MLGAPIDNTITAQCTPFINQAYSEYKHVLANILRSRYVARTPPLETRRPGCRSNVENAPPSTASHRPASHAHLQLTVCNFENASVTRQSLISNARTLRVN